MSNLCMSNCRLLLLLVVAVALVSTVSAIGTDVYSDSACTTKLGGYGEGVNNVCFGIYGLGTATKNTTCSEVNKCAALGGQTSKAYTDCITTITGSPTTFSYADKIDITSTVILGSSVSITYTRTLFSDVNCATQTSSSTDYDSVDTSACSAKTRSIAMDGVSLSCTWYEKSTVTASPSATTVASSALVAILCAFLVVSQ